MCGGLGFMMKHEEREEGELSEEEEEAAAPGAAQSSAAARRDRRRVVQADVHGQLAALRRSLREAQQDKQKTEGAASLSAAKAREASALQGRRDEDLRLIAGSKAQAKKSEERRVEAERLRIQADGAVKRIHDEMSVHVRALQHAVQALRPSCATEEQQQALCEVRHIGVQI